jgi:hypothetical protein
MIKLNEATIGMLWRNAKKQIKESTDRINSSPVYDDGTKTLEVKIAYTEREFEIISKLKNMLIENGLDVDNTFDITCAQQINVFEEHFASLDEEKRLIEYVLQEDLGNAA